jgi:hypothetical protein
MPSSLHNLFHTLLAGWLETGTAPDAPVEGVTLAFAGMLGAQPSEFTFDAHLHRAQEPGWAWRAITFGDIFEGAFSFYLPQEWSDVAQEGAWAWLSEGGVQQQAIVVVHESFWQPHVRGLVEQGEVLAFAYYPLLRPSYHQWVFALADESGQGATTYAAFSAGEWIVAVQAAAASGPALARQLTSLVNTSPWHGWIQAASAQRESAGQA